MAKKEDILAWIEARTFNFLEKVGDKECRDTQHNQEHVVTTQMELEEVKSKLDAAVEKNNLLMMHVRTKGEMASGYQDMVRHHQRLEREALLKP